jgi:glycosyltransferase involved in cell wall biosynthesis
MTGREENREPRVAFVQDALPVRGGAEKVLEAALEAFPQAELFTSVYREEAFRGSPIGTRQVHTSFLDRLPGAHAHHRAFLPLMPLAIERLDLRGFDVVVSFSYAVAHWLRPRPGQLHVSYVHTPLRYAWQESAAGHLLERLPAPAAWGAKVYLRAFRRWDRRAAARSDHLLTVSEWMAGCIERAYGRWADVIYPPVDLAGFHPYPLREDYYVTVSRLVAHKRVDLVVEAFNRLERPLIVIGDGPELPRLQKLAGPTVRLVGWQAQERLAETLGRARAFIHAGEEDFGIAMVEAQAAGCPVIAYAGGAAREIVQPGRIGLLFPEQTSDALSEAVLRFQAIQSEFDPEAIALGAARFSRERFVGEFTQAIRGDWQHFRERSTEEQVPLASGLPLAPRREGASRHGY